MVILYDDEYDVTLIGETLEEVVDDYEDNYAHRTIAELRFFKAEEMAIKRKLEFV